MNAVIVSLVLFLGGGFYGAVAGMCGRNSQAGASISAMAAAFIGFAASVHALLSASDLFVALPWTIAGLRIGFHLDGLAAFFLVPIYILVFCSALYAVRYNHLSDGFPRIGAQWFFHNLLAAGMVLVVCAADVPGFLISWEIMALSSFFLVTYHYKDEAARRAGWIYFIAAHTGAAFLFLFFLQAAMVCGSFDFAAFSGLRTMETSTVLLFAAMLIGFGSKAGLFPMHVWLPDAHPSAPSHVSALMSGVMVKTGIYGILRMLTFLPTPGAWHGMVLIVLGISGALYGISQAAVQNDCKRLLAYSSVENIGIIFAGLGFWLFASASGQHGVAALALAGSLLHIWNHSLFKGMLFLGAGSLQHATGSGLLSSMGGLLKRMPVTGFMMICGAMAITALPPMNGFIGEWLFCIGLLKMGLASPGGIALLPILLLVLLALVGGIALIAFSKLAGISLLGGARTANPSQVKEAPFSMRAAMALLFCLCLVIGVLPHLILPALNAPLDILSGVEAKKNLAAALPPLGFLWSIGAVLLLFLVFVLALRGKRTGKDVPPAVPTWGCGYARPSASMSYTAGSYGQLMWNCLLPVRLRPLIRTSVLTGLFPKKNAFRLLITEPILQQWFAPFFSRLAGWAYGFRLLQAGQLNIYLLYIFITTSLLVGLVILLP